MGSETTWGALTRHVFQSEINCLTGLGDLALITELQERGASKGRDEPQAELSKKIELISGLWALRIAAVVATLYIVVGYGVVTSAWVTGGIALLFYGVQYVELREIPGLSSDMASFAPRHTVLIYAVGYVSLVNFLAGFPYLAGRESGPRYLWMFQVLVTVVSAAIVLGYAFSVPEIRDAYGCYADESFMQLGSRGICPQSPLGHNATCLRQSGATPAASHCETLPWAGTIGASVLRVARTVLAVGLGVYAASFDANYRAMVR